MKKMLAALALALTLPTCALGDSEGVIVQSSCNIVQSGDYYLAYCFAQVHNNASTVICLDQGTFDLQSGETLLSTSEVSQIWPYFLSPGEDGYLFDIVSFEPDENGNPVIPSITGISYNVTYLPVDNAYASYDLSAVSEIAQDVSGDVSVVCRLTNSTDMDAYNPTVALGLYTDDGTMVYADGTTLQDVVSVVSVTEIITGLFHPVFQHQARDPRKLSHIVRHQDGARRDGVPGNGRVIRADRRPG